MSRINMNISDDLQKKVDQYCELNDMTRTTFYHMALSHYLEHLKLSSDLENIFKSFIGERIERLEQESK